LEIEDADAAAASVMLGASILPFVAEEAAVARPVRYGIFPA
jgi:hypothetical protein